MAFLTVGVRNYMNVIISPLSLISDFLMYNRQIKKFPTEKQNVSLKHILT